MRGREEGYPKIQQAASVVGPFGPDALAGVQNVLQALPPLQVAAHLDGALHPPSRRVLAHHCAPPSRLLLPFRLTLQFDCPARAGSRVGRISLLIAQPGMADWHMPGSELQNSADLEAGILDLG